MIGKVRYLAGRFAARQQASYHDGGYSRPVGRRSPNAPRCETSSLLWGMCHATGSSTAVLVNTTTALIDTTIGYKGERAFHG